MAIKADIKPVDRGEMVSLMEPLLLGPRHREPLEDLALELTQNSAGFRASLPASIMTSLAHLVRSMNCYYSNLIEGHNTHPVDIELALKMSSAAMPAIVICNGKQKPTSLYNSGLMPGVCRAGTLSLRGVSARFTVVFANYCQKTFSGLKTPPQKTGLA